MTLRASEAEGKGAQVYKDTLHKNPNSLDAKAAWGKSILRKKLERPASVGMTSMRIKLTLDAKTLLDEVLIKDEDNVAAEQQYGPLPSGTGRIRKAEESVTRVLNIEHETLPDW